MKKNHLVCKNCGKRIYRLRTAVQYCYSCKKKIQDNISKEIIKEQIDRINRGEPLTIPLRILDVNFKNKYYNREKAKLPQNKAYLKAWRIKNKERINAWYREYVKKPTINARIKKYNIAYYSKNRERLSEKNKLNARNYYKKNRDKVLARHRAYSNTQKYQDWLSVYEHSPNRKAQRRIYRKENELMNNKYVIIDIENKQQKTIVICEVCKLKKLYPYEEALKIAIAHKKGYHKVI